MSTSEPEGPTGVWFQYEDGTRYSDLPTIFQEFSDEGVAMFEVMPPRDPEVERPVSIGADRWPGMSGLILPPLAGHP